MALLKADDPRALSQVEAIKTSPGLFRLRVDRQHRVLFERKGPRLIVLHGFRYRNDKKQDYDKINVREPAEVG